MKGVIVYDTSHGNTMTIAETIAGTLKESGIDVDLLRVGDPKKPSAKDYDFLVLGCPTRFGTMSFAVRDFLKEMKSEGWMNKPFAAFDTELPDNLLHKEWSAAEEIAAKLLKKKMVELLPVLKTCVLETRGPLREGEVERTRDYTKQLAGMLEGRTSGQ